MAGALRTSIAAAGHAPVLLRVASPAQYSATLRSAAEAWANRLTTEQYIERELMVSRSEHAAGMLCWVLVPEHEPDSLDFRCSCETWPAPSYDCPPHTRKVTIRPAIGAFTLFVPEQHRAQGYATLMSILLFERLPKDDLRWSDDRMLELSIACFFGFSDIGEEFYEAFAQTVSPYSIHWRADEPIAGRPLPSSSRRSLKIADFPHVASADQTLIKQELPLAESTSAHRICLIPRAATWSIKCECSEYMWEALGPPSGAPPSARPEIFGCEVSKAGDEDWAFVIWSMVWDYKVLVIMRLRATTRSQLVTLIRAAQTEAQRLGLDRVSAWNVDSSLLDHTSGEQLERREDALPELCWLGETKDVSWLHLEAYANTPA